METSALHRNAVNAYLELIAINMGSWRSEVAAWLHSADAESALRELLVAVPCSPTLH
jgi:hypothetical protein